MSWHFTITNEMRELGLKGNELLVYAIVNGYSANHQGCFYGSIDYICDLTGMSYRTAQSILRDLTDRGLLIKVAQWGNDNNRTCFYEVSAKISDINEGCRQKLPSMSAEIADNNKSYNKCLSPVVDKSTTPPKGVPAPKSSQIVQLFLNDGCAADDVRDWIVARKGAKVTEAVYRGMKREAAKAHITLAEAVRICAENSWRGFRAEYLERKTAPAKKETGGTFMSDIGRTYAKLAEGWAARAAQMNGGQQ